MMSVFYFSSLFHAQRLPYQVTPQQTAGNFKVIIKLIRYYIKKLDQKIVSMRLENVARFWGASRNILAFLFIF